MDLSAKVWDDRYINNDDRWDLGEVSPPLKAYFDSLEDKNTRILIPGCGNSYEAEYLFKKGFQNIFVVDLSKTALNNLQKRVPNFPAENLIHGDFFALKLTFDLVIEQTFFCAIDPKLRQQYADKMQEILSKNGKLVGLFWHVPLNNDKPPFGGNEKEYKGYFSKNFEIEKMEKCYNSFHNRQGRELFVKLIKK